MFELDKIIKAIDLALASGGEPIAAFDADGTLWETDMGEQFFNYQIKNQLLSGLPSNAWEYYFELKEKESPQAAYLWLAQINVGQNVEQMLKWSKDCESKLNVPYIESQKKIINYLQSKGVEVFVVTASIRYAVAAAVEFFNIPFENVLGVDVELDEEGKLTTRQLGPITWREGKSEALLVRTKNKKPFFCSGNTIGDLSLLELSTHLQLALAKAKPNESIYSTEQELLAIAKERGWAYCE